MGNTVQIFISLQLLGRARTLPSSSAATVVPLRKEVTYERLLHARDIEGVMVGESRTT